MKIHIRSIAAKATVRIEKFKDKKNSDTFKSCFFYRILVEKRGINFVVAACKVLAAPYLIIAVSYIVIRWNALNAVPIDFWIELTIASTWFVFGPILVFKFMESFTCLKDRVEFPLNLRKWFENNENRHYKIYKRCMAIISPIFIILGVFAILLHSDILTKTVCITTGYNDIYYWIVVAFLLWFLIYVTNALAAIVLMLMIVYTVKKHDVIDYNPIDISHHNGVEGLNKFCNKIVSYMCSGLLFLPIAFLFLRQQAHIEWVSALLLFYGIFLLAAITYPRLTINSYISKKSKKYLLEEKLQYLEFVKFVKLLPSEEYKELHLYNSYVYIQELKTVCPVKIGFDTNTIMTYLSVLVSVVTSIPGFVNMIL